MGCILPKRRDRQLRFEDYLQETRKLDGKAEVLLWPEGAVTFRDESERAAALAKVQESIRGSHVGVSFEESVRDPSDITGRSLLRRNGMVVVSNKSSSPHLEYYKRHLVPGMLFLLSLGIDALIFPTSCRIIFSGTFYYPCHHLYHGHEESVGREEAGLGTSSVYETCSVDGFHLPRLCHSRNFGCA